MDFDTLKEDVTAAGHDETSLAGVLGCHPSYINRLLKGTRRLRIDLLKEICNIIKQPVYKYFPVDELDKKIFCHLPTLTKKQKLLLLRFLSDPESLQDILALKIQK